MRTMLPIVLMFSSAFTHCIGWDEYYGTETHSVESSEGGPEMVAIKAGRKGSYYLVDQTRALCFFQNGDSLTAVDCSSIPQAAALLGHPPQEASGTEQIPNPTKTTTNKKKAPVASAANEELNAFKAAYTAIVCKSRQGAPFAPSTLIMQHNLTVERYTELEGILARQKKEWSALTRHAAKSCSSAVKEPASPNNQPTQDEGATQPLAE